VTGLGVALVQLTLLQLLLEAGAPALPANALAFFLAANLNFAVSSAFTWADRPTEGVAARWVRFFTAIAGTSLLNMATYALALPVTGELPAAALGLAVAAAVNFIAADRVVFVPAPGGQPSQPATASTAARS